MNEAAVLFNEVLTWLIDPWSIVAQLHASQVSRGSSSSVRVPVSSPQSKKVGYNNTLVVGVLVL